MNGEHATDTRLAEVMSRVQIPLDNVAFTIEAYLMANGTRLDNETRCLLAGIRDCADRVASSVRVVIRQNASALPQAGLARMAMRAGGAPL